MSKTTVTIFLFLMCTISFAQTRRVAHRAHSGSATEHYDGLDGNYGEVPLQEPRPQSLLVTLKADTLHTKTGQDSIIYIWDTLPDSSIPRQNEIQHKPVHRLRDLGTICSPITISE